MVTHGSVWPFWFYSFIHSLFLPDIWKCVHSIKRMVQVYYLGLITRMLSNESCCNFTSPPALFSPWPSSLWALRGERINKLYSPTGTDSGIQPPRAPPESRWPLHVSRRLLDSCFKSYPGTVCTHTLLSFVCLPILCVWDYSSCLKGKFEEQLGVWWWTETFLLQSQNP